MSLSIESRNTVSGQSHNEKKSLRRSWKSSGPVAKWAVIFAGVAALASVTYAIIAGSQLGVMSGQLRQMQQSLAQNRTANELELRPYVHANKLELLGELKQGQKFQGRIEITNSGRTPAIKIQGCADIAIKPNADPMTDDFPCPAPNNPRARLQPTGEHSTFALGSGIPFILMSPGTTISPMDQLFPLLSNGGLRLYLYGTSRIRT